MQRITKGYFKSKSGVYIIAEIGGNHEGNFTYAKRLTYLAAQSGVDAIKYQIYTGDSLVNPLKDPERNKHFKKFQLKKEEYLELAKLCRRLKVTFMASVWDASSIDYIHKYISIYKIGSGDLTAYNLIKKIARTGKPIILSTGLSNLNEIFDVVNFIKKTDSSYINDRKLALLQCTSMYPTQEEEINLNAMLTIKEKTGLPVGYSGHTEGMEAAEIAVIMGAEIIELHFTDTRKNKKFRDHKISVTKGEIKEFIKKIKRIKIIQGSFEKKPTDSEIESRHILSFRRAVFPVRDLKTGEIIKENDLITLRPNLGIDAKDFFNLIGKKVKGNLKKYQQLDQNKIQ